MKATIDVYLYPGDDTNMTVVTTRYGTTLTVGDGVTVNWMGDESAARAAATLRRLADELDQQEPLEF